MSYESFAVGLKMSIELYYMNYVMTPLIGWEKGQYFITRLVYVNGAPIKLKSKDNVKIRFFDQGVAYGFQTEVLGTLSYPAPLIFMKYPSDIQHVSIRRAERYRTNIPAVILNTLSAVKAEATIVDISVEGCGVRVPVQEKIELEPDRNCFLTFSVMDRNFEVDCVIRKIKNRGNDRIIGAEFVNISADNLQILKSFIEVLRTLSSE